LTNSIEIIFEAMILFKVLIYTGMPVRCSAIRSDIGSQDDQQLIQKCDLRDDIDDHQFPVIPRPTLNGPSCPRSDTLLDLISHLPIVFQSPCRSARFPEFSIKSQYIFLSVCFRRDWGPIFHLFLSLRGPSRKSPIGI
jgi:hypothetical protein